VNFYCKGIKIFTRKYIYWLVFFDKTINNNNARDSIDKLVNNTINVLKIELGRKPYFSKDV
jgi:hypothetical protein